MAKRTKATDWEIISRDSECAIVKIEYVCPHCKMNSGNIFTVREPNASEMEGPFETDQICEVCNEEVTVRCC
jgi:hypothetical protein